VKITPTLLFNYLQCPHKPWRDLYGPEQEKSKDVNPFLELLWSNGVLHEKEVISNFTNEIIDLSEGTVEERLQRTKEAMEAKIKNIYQGVIQFDDIFGIPDLLSYENNVGYTPTDIKSGGALEDESLENGIEGKQKKHYAVQLSVYSDILINLGYSKAKKGYILDRDKNLVEYDFSASLGPRNQKTYWDFYLEIKEKVKMLITNEAQNLPAISGTCKLCQWQDSCKKWAKNSGDLTLIFNLGRKVRDVLVSETDIRTVEDLALADLSPLIERKETDSGFLKGVGEKSLKTAKKRAEILHQNSPPILYKPIFLPEVTYECFFDVEDDPTRDLLYLTGVYVRNKESSEYKSFIAESPNEESEKKAWAEFWSFVRTLPSNDFAFYYYSQHEKTTYRKLHKKYPDVITQEELEDFFTNPNTIDLYQIVTQNTDWPLNSYSIKAIANYLGFKWRDKTPSGAASIEWYNRYCETGDKHILTRILEYNCDDCIATIYLKDKLVEMNKRFTLN